VPFCSGVVVLLHPHSPLPEGRFRVFAQVMAPNY
jgi:hypothetical protein